MKAKLEFKEFIDIESKLEIQVGMILSIEDVPKSNKLYKLEVDFGEEKRTVVTNIKNIVESDKLLNNSFLFVTNLLPTTIMGIESTAMILPVEIEKLGLIKIISNTGNKLI